MLRRIIAAAVCLSFVAASCSSSSDDNQSESTRSSSPVSGGELVMGIDGGNSGGWCLPEAQLAAAGIQMGKAIYEPLTAINADGEYVPFLAESMEPNADFTSWTIKIREGIKFHDGTDLDATVVKNNIDALRGEYPARSPLLATFTLADIDTVTEPDSMTVEITTLDSWPTLPSYFGSGGRFGIMGQAQLDDQETCDSNLIGTGPFSLEEWVPNGHFTATKFADYWQVDSDGTRLPYLDKITFRPMVEADARMNSLLSGQIHMLHGSGAPQLETLTEEAEAGVVDIYRTEKFSEVTYEMLNAAKEPFNNKNARLALAHSFDRDLYNEVVGLGFQTSASGPFAPGNLGYLEDAGLPEYDLEKAKSYVAKYTAETGKPLSFNRLTVSGADSLQNAQFFQSESAKAGIEITIQQVEQAALINRALGGDWQSIGWRNHPGGDPDLQRAWWFSSSPVNFGGIDDPDIDALLGEGRKETDLEKRQEIYADLNRRFGEQAYNLWRNWTLWYKAMAPNVGGILGPNLPDGSEPFPGLSSGNPVSGLWMSP